MDSKLKFLLFIGFKHYIGKANNRAWRDFKWEWRRDRNWPHTCYECHKIVRKTRKEENATHFLTHDTLTLDHIIPKSLIFELGLWELVYEPDNFQLLCFACNSTKSNDKLRTSELSHSLLTKYYIAMDRRNKELASIQT